MTTMSEAAVERARAGQLADDDIVGILRHQHALIPDLFSEVHGSTGAHRRRAFNELRALLAVHEAAEEMVLRPVTAEIARSVADARNREEKEAARLLRELERTDIHSEEFRRRLTAFQKAVIRHAEHEENDEFPILRAARGKEERRQLGRRLRLAERIAPTHPHPSAAGSPAAQWILGPVASIVDRVRDAVVR